MPPGHGEGREFARTAAPIGPLGEPCCDNNGSMHHYCQAASRPSIDCNITAGYDFKLITATLHYLGLDFGANTQPIPLIQGPPGTGKTTVALETLKKIVVYILNLLGLLDIARRFLKRNPFRTLDASQSTAADLIVDQIKRLESSKRGLKILIPSTNHAAVDNIAKKLNK